MGISILSKSRMVAYILNLFDLFCTLYALPRGAVELNPLMQSVPFMVFYKAVIVGGLLWWLSRRHEKIALLGMRICTAVYVCLDVYHLYFIL